MTYYTLDLYIKPLSPERDLQETARNIWRELGRLSVTIQPVDRSATGLPVFRFAALDPEDLRVVGRWYTGDDPEELRKLMQDIGEHGA